MTRLARTADGLPLLGNDAGFVPLTAAHEDLGSIEEALPRAASDALRPTAGTAHSIPEDQIRFGRPMGSLGTLWGIGLNFAGHAGDLEEDLPDSPASFTMPPSTAIGPGGPIRLPPTDIAEEVTAEAELAVVIGRTCQHVNSETATEVIAGYLPVIDVTAADILRRNPRFLTRSKAFDSFLVMGSEIIGTEGVESLGDVQIRTVVNGTVEAENTIDEMRFSPHEIVAHLSEVATLRPGDVICTGTPGSHTIDRRDVVRAEIPGVGNVSSSVVRSTRR